MEESSSIGFQLSLVLVVSLLVLRRNYMEESLLTLCAPITRGNKRHVFKDMKIVSREATVEGEPKKVFHIFR